MAYYYTVITQDTEPDIKKETVIWIAPGIGQASICIGGQFIPFGGSDSFSARDEVRWTSITVQDTQPSGKTAGDIWISETLGQVNILLASFIPFGGM